MTLKKLLPVLLIRLEECLALNYSIMRTVKVYVESSDYGYSAYMENVGLDYACIGEGKTVEEAIEDFEDSYKEIKEYYCEQKLEFSEVEFEFYYDISSFLQEFNKAFSLSGLERITGVNQTQLGHYLHNRRKPSRKTINRIEEGLRSFASHLTAIHFA